MGKASLNTDITNIADVPTSDKYTGMTGAQVFHEMMREHGVEVIFGLPGGAALPVFDAIFNSDYFKFIRTRHEQGAGHMAEGYARASGKVGVVLVTSGPGATNMVTPLQDAYMDGTPLVVFSGQVASFAIGSDAFQEADVTGITRPCTKWNVLVKDVRQLPRRINEAFHIATSGRPGPVVVDLPKDVTAGLIKEDVPIEPHLPGDDNGQSGAPDEIKSVADLINRAKKPVFYVGQGVILSEATKVLRKIAEKANIPVTTTLQGLGAIDEQLPLALHMVGMHGSAYANYAIQDADLLISVGARFDDRVTGRTADFAPEARRADREGRGGIVHFDIAPEQIGKVVPTTIGVEGDARKNLELLLPLVEKNKRSEWIEKVAKWKNDFPFRYKKAGKSGLIKPQAVVEELYRQTNGDSIVVTGVGQHQMWAAQFYNFHFPRQWVSSGGLGTMGFGVPACIGAKLACPDKMVVAIDGDGSFCMTGVEMSTACQYDIPVKILILNNVFYGMVKQWQDLFYENRYSHTQLHNPDFVKFSQACGCVGIGCDKGDDLAAKMTEFLECDRPVVMEVMVDQDEHVYPMVPAGAALHEMEFGDTAD